VPQPGIANGAGRRGDFLRQIDSPCGVRRVERRQGRFPRDRGGDTDLAWPRSCASRWPVAIPAGGQGEVSAELQCLEGVGQAGRTAL